MADIFDAIHAEAQKAKDPAAELGFEPVDEAAELGFLPLSGKDAGSSFPAGAPGGVLPGVPQPSVPMQKESLAGALTGPLPGEPGYQQARAAVARQYGSTTGLREGVQTARQGARRLYGWTGVPKVIQGVRDVTEGNPEWATMALGQYGVQTPPELHRAPKNPRLVEKGVNEALQGGLQAGAMAAGVTAPAALVAPQTIAGVGAGMAVQQGAQRAARHFGASPEAAELIGTGAGIVAGGAVGAGTGKGLEYFGERARTQARLNAEAQAEYERSQAAQRAAAKAARTLPEASAVPDDVPAEAAASSPAQLSERAAGVDTNLVQQADQIGAQIAEVRRSMNAAAVRGDWDAYGAAKKDVADLEQQRDAIQREIESRNTAGDEGPRESEVSSPHALPGREEPAPTGIAAGQPVRGALTTGGSAASAPVAKAPPPVYGAARTEAPRGVVLPSIPRDIPAGSSPASRRPITVGPDGVARIESPQLPASVLAGRDVTRAIRNTPAPSRGSLVPNAGTAVVGVDEGTGLPILYRPPGQMNVPENRQLERGAVWLGSGSHPAGKITGIDQETGLPIVDRTQASAQTPANPVPGIPLVAKGGQIPPQTATAGPMSPEAEAVSRRAQEAAEQTAREPGNQGEMAAASSQPQPVGAREAETGRTITQPSENPATNQALATSAMPEFESGLKDAVKSVPGAEVVATRERKNPGRLAEKIEGEGQPAETVSDYGAAQIAVDSPAARDAAIAAVKQRFPVVREEDNFDHGDPEFGYRSFTMQVEMPNGSTMELQVVPREVYEANRSEHGDYKAAREAQIEGRDAGGEIAAARAKNDAAMEKFNERNANLTKNSSSSIQPRSNPSEREENPIPGHAAAEQTGNGEAIRAGDLKTGQEVEIQKPGLTYLRTGGRYRVEVQGRDVRFTNVSTGSSAIENMGSLRTAQMRLAVPSTERKSAGEMERNSSLFEGASANPQGGLFHSSQLLEKLSPGERLKALIARSELRAAELRDRVDNLIHSKFTVVRIPERNTAPMLRLNADGFWAIVKGIDNFRGDWLAVTLPSGWVTPIAKWLRLVGEKAPELQHLSDAFEEAKTDAGIILLRGDSTKPDWLEEQNHLWDLRYDSTSGTVATRMARFDVFQKTVGYLEKSRYEVSKLRSVVREIFAKAANGELLQSKILTRSENDRLLAMYFDQVAQDGNLDALDHLPEMPGNTNAIARHVAEVHREIAVGSGNTGVRREAGGRRSLPDSSEPNRTGVRTGSEGIAGQRQGSVSGDEGPLFQRSGQPELRHGGLGAVDLSRVLPAPVRDYLAETSAKIHESRKLQNGLYDLDSQHDADVLRAIQFLKKLPGTPEDFEAIYHHLEDKSIRLTPKQYQILHYYLNPIIKQNQALFEKLNPNKKAIENYVHRIAAGKGSLLERILSGSKANGSGNLLRKSAAASKKRSMMALESADGKRVTVSVGRGRVTKWLNGVPVDIGALRSGLTNPGKILDERLAPLDRETAKLEQELRTLKGTKSRQEAARRRIENIQKKLEKLDSDRAKIEHEHLAADLPDKLWRDKNGNLWTFRQATTKEIEANTPVSYYKNAAASTIMNNLELLKANRAYDFMENFKSSPEFANGAIKPENPGEIPEGWRSTQLPQFVGYYFEPHIAEVFDWYANKIKGGQVGFYSQLANALTTAIFLNPIAHIPNLTSIWTTTRLDKLVNPLTLRKEFKAGLRALDAVIHQNSDFLNALDHGAALHSQKALTRKFAAELVKRLADEAQNPTVKDRLAQAFGYAVRPDLILKNLVEWTSDKFTWNVSDILYLQSIYATMAERDITFDQAIQAVNRYFPTGRMPARVANSSKASKALHSDALMFMRYHYNTLAAFGHMAMDVAGLGFHEAGTNAAGEPINAEGETRDQQKMRAAALIASLGVFTYVILPQLDRLAKAVTGDENAMVRRPGFSTYPNAVRQVSNGQRTPMEAARLAFTPAILPELAVDLAANRDVFGNEDMIYNPAAPPKELAKQIGRRVAGVFSPAEMAMRAEDRPGGWKRQLWSEMGVSFPRPTTPALTLARNIERAQDPYGFRNDVQRKHAQAMHEIEDEIQQNRLDPAKVRQYIDRGELSERDLRRASSLARTPAIARVTARLGIEDALRVFKKANPEEKEILRPVLQRKAHLIEAIRNQDAREKAVQDYRAAMSQSPVTPKRRSWLSLLAAGR